MALVKNKGGGVARIQYVLFALSIICVLDPIQFFAHAADPDPLQDFCVADTTAVEGGVRMNGYPCKDRALVTSDDFVFTGLRNKGTHTSNITSVHHVTHQLRAVLWIFYTTQLWNNLKHSLLMSLAFLISCSFDWRSKCCPHCYLVAGNTSVTGTDAVITFALVDQYPGLNTQGISHVRLDLEPGGVIPLHSHPLATETIFVVEGTINTGFVSHENILFSKILQKGDVFIFPRGLLHFQENVGNKSAICFNSFNAQFPALLLAANQMFATNISTSVLTKSFGASQIAMKYLAAVLPRYWGWINCYTSPIFCGYYMWTMCYKNAFGVDVLCYTTH